MSLTVRLVQRVATLAFVASTLLFTSCDSPNEPYGSDFYIPKYLSLASLRNGVSISGPQPMYRTGKMLVSGSHVFVLDSLRGIHVIDCSSPAASTPIAFIAIPGAGGFGIKQGSLYAESYIDLLTFDISNPGQPRLSNRMENVFPQLLVESGLKATIIDSGVVTGWELVKGSMRTYNDGMVAVQTPLGERTMRVEVLDPELYGTRVTNKTFDVVGAYLYVGLESELRVLSIQQPLAPAEWSRVSAGWRVTNTFVHADRLFVAMDYDVTSYDVSDPSNPTAEQRWWYARACNKLAAHSNVMYVAERFNAGCNASGNYLYTVEDTGRQYDESVKEFPLSEPFALHVEGQRLYVCDGFGGFKVYDITTASTPVLVGSLPNIHCQEVALLGTTAVVSATDGLHVLDCANPAAISELNLFRSVR